MAKGSVNKVILIGNLGRDPEVRYTSGGSAVANVSIATTDTWKDKQSGEQQDRTEWHNLVFYARLAEIVGEYLKKGAKIFVEGRLQTRKWQDKNGQDRYTTEIVVNEMQMLDGRGSGGGSTGGNAPESGGGRGRESSGGAPRNAPADDFDDDIPF